MKRFAVIGLGRFGFHVARDLYEDGHEVVAMDCAKGPVQLVEPYCSEAMVLDATEKDRLKALGLDMMDAVVVSIGTQISNSILICLHLQEIGVKRIIAKALDEDHAKILRKVGAHEVVHPEKDMALLLARDLSRPNVLDFIPMEKDYSVAEVPAAEEFVGKSLSKLGLRNQYHVHVIAVKDTLTDSVQPAPPASYHIQAHDVLIVFGKQADIQALREAV